MTINANAKMAINGNTKITTNGNAKVATNGNAKTTTNGNAKSIYILNSGAAETEHDRLNVQHHLFSDIMQGDLLPPHIASGLKASRPAPKVLEIATGTGIWLTEMAKTLSPDAELVGLDFDTSKFPSQSFLPPNVTLRQANMYEPFPSDLHGRFDVVHVRLIIFALKEGQGTDLVRNLMTLLRPGGHIVWAETGPGMLSKSHFKFMPVESTSSTKHLCSRLTFPAVSMSFGIRGSVVPDPSEVHDSPFPNDALTLHSS
jgi:2-polyprenyl-3-methyl-5-hydroxy-6-metoxy-1,4-benzoquinol methylase